MQLAHSRIHAQEVEHGAVESRDGGVDGSWGEVPSEPERGVEGADEVGGGHALKPLGEEVIPKQGDGGTGARDLPRGGVRRPGRSDSLYDDYGDAVVIAGIGGGSLGGHRGWS